jgi:hypothetical protein
MGPLPGALYPLREPLSNKQERGISHRGSIKTAVFATIPATRRGKPFLEMPRPYIAPTQTASAPGPYPLSAAGSSSGGAIGTVKVNVLPSPTTLSTPMWPPWASTRPLAM